MGKKILIIAAHPDDEILGCGGTAARMVEEGNDVFTLILGEGVTSRDEHRERDKREEDIRQLKEMVNAANGVIGVKEVFTLDFPDNRFDRVALLDVVKEIEKVKNRVQPGVIFTHYERDLNIDHRVTLAAVLTATRPMPGESVKEIYAFEVLSSTEWNFPLTFSPECFFDITGTLGKKMEAMAKYKTELREYPHPRSLKGILLQAENWGMKMGMEFAEAFQVVRLIK